ncbi:flavoprotein [Paenibacillus zeisoli]|uniref:Flavoprotein n=1 Tax=Paenibacillus zeisoli TaxID=2496267 RepID=A0A433XC85_9BACL|nr:NAD(P)-binding domain-containing protein [Paenibacillus zeisoli]RUT31767.1 flavoprotein [Paenibacillus zeisoli]
MNNQLPVAIVGGGPVALAAAAQLVQRNLPFVLFEKGPNVGASVLSWKHVRMFSTWEFNIDPAAKELLLESGWIAPNPNDLPTGHDLVELYLKPLSQLGSIKPNLFLNAEVTAVYRKDMDKMKTLGREKAPFILEYNQDGMTGKVEASAVIDATGTWLSSNPMTASGKISSGELKYGEHIRYGIPDILDADYRKYAGKNVAVIGSGHSAIQSLILLHQLQQHEAQTQIHWILRKQQVDEAFGGGENDGLLARGELGLKANRFVHEGKVEVHTPFLVQEVRQDHGTRKLTLIGQQSGEQAEIPHLDEIIVATGSRPDFSFLSELRYTTDSAIECVPQLANLIDPNIHSCGTVRPHGEAELQQPEKNLYIVGAKSYGRAPTFLLATGYEQVRSVVAALAGDFVAAREVKLKLPQTGVCSVSKKRSISVQAATGCCGPTVPASGCGPKSC